MCKIKIVVNSFGLNNFWYVSVDSLRAIEQIKEASCCEIIFGLTKAKIAQNNDFLSKFTHNYFVDLKFVSLVDNRIYSNY